MGLVYQALALTGSMVQVFFGAGPSGSVKLNARGLSRKHIIEGTQVGCAMTGKSCLGQHAPGP